VIPFSASETACGIAFRTRDAGCRKLAARPLTRRR
jgi:hypothetical protein